MQNKSILTVVTFAIASAGPLHGVEAPENSKLLTAEQVAREQPKAEVTVQFYVDYVGLEGWNHEWLEGELPGEHYGDPPIRLESRETLPGAGAGTFYVLLRGEAANKAAKAVQPLAPKEDQDTLCVVRLYRPLKKHFTGQKVIATGKIDRIKLDRTVIYADGDSEGPRTISTDYVMTIDKPENVRFFQQLQGNDTTRQSEDKARCEWLARIIKQVETIKVGMTRKDVENVLVEDGGGFANPKAMRYQYPACGYVKLDLEFELAASGDRKDDKITKRSAPLLDLVPNRARW